MHHMRTFVLSEHGEAMWNDVLQSLSQTDRETVRSVVPMGWYALSLQHTLLAAIRDTVAAADPNVVTTIGRYEADQDLTRVHRLFLRMANPAFVLEKAGQYWSRFYDSGTWTVERTASNKARGTLRALEPTDPLFCEYLNAYIGRMWELVGAKDVQARHPQCRCNDDAACVFEGVWR